MALSTTALQNIVKVMAGEEEVEKIQPTQLEVIISGGDNKIFQMNFEQTQRDVALKDPIEFEIEQGESVEEFDIKTDDGTGWEIVQESINITDDDVVKKIVKIPYYIWYLSSND